jgi:hypothetical protein
MKRLFFGIGVALALALVGACGGGGSDSAAVSGSTTPTPNGVATLSGLQGQLASVVLQQSDMPDGLDGSGPTFSTDEDVAGPNVQALQTMVQEGRQLGVDVQFIPTDRLDPNSPLRGGVQSSASVYTNANGASQSFNDTASQARANDWAANYPDLQNLQVTTVPQTIGDESLWLRIVGVDQCPGAVTASPGANGSAPSPTNCGDAQLVVLDNVILRVGRIRQFLQISSFYHVNGHPDQLQSQILQWAQTVAQRSAATFPA